MKYPVEIKAHLEGTLTTLQAAKQLLGMGQYDSAVARAADAAFHTGSMLLLDEEIEPARHGDVVTLIQEIFVNGRRLTKDQGGNLTWLFALRNAGDHPASTKATPDDAQKAVQFAESFFDAAKVILEG